MFVVNVSEYAFEVLERFTFSSPSIELEIIIRKLWTAQCKLISSILSEREKSS